MAKVPSYIANDKTFVPNEERLATAQGWAIKLRDQQQFVAQLEEELKDAKRRMSELQHEILPDAMDAAGIDRVGIPAWGNHPACDVILSPFHHASIPADWSEEKRAAAFAALTEAGHEDLIKTEFTIQVSRHDRPLADTIIKFLEKLDTVLWDKKESVHWKTLTAWVKEQLEDHKPIPPLDVIGAQIGRVAKVKERSS